jgi:hypothetical protein
VTGRAGCWNAQGLELFTTNDIAADELREFTNKFASALAPNSGA